MTQPQPAKSDPQKKAPRAHCPTCKRLFVVPSDPARRHKSFPFCSERCKLIDLGAWLDAEYRIPTAPDDEFDDTLAEEFGDA